MVDDVLSRLALDEAHSTMESVLHQKVRGNGINICTTPLLDSLLASSTHIHTPSIRREQMDE